MVEKQIQNILNQLAKHESRIIALEGKISKAPSSSDFGQKQKTLREIIGGKKFRNGPEKIAAIVGYHEFIRESLIHKDNINKEWVEAKFDRQYKTNLLKDAKDSLVRINKDGFCDLTQTGERFFKELLKNESASSTSK